MTRTEAPRFKIVKKSKTENKLRGKKKKKGFLMWILNCV